MFIYKVIDYFDVWGNEQDGFEVNNLAEIFQIKVVDYTNYDEILNKLKEKNYLVFSCKVEDFEIYNDYDFIEFYESKNNKPLFRLERIQ